MKLKKRNELFDVKSVVSASEISRVYRLYSVDTKTPLTHTLSHKGRGYFSSIDFVVSSVERWEGLREGEIFHAFLFAA